MYKCLEIVTGPHVLQFETLGRGEAYPIPLSHANSYYIKKVSFFIELKHISNSLVNGILGFSFSFNLKHVPYLPIMGLSLTMVPLESAWYATIDKNISTTENLMTFMINAQQIIALLCNLILK